MKKLRYMLEAAFLGFAFLIFNALPYTCASNVGGWIGRTIGPRLGASRKAYNNLTQAFPGRSGEEYQAYIRAMWDNLGRVIAEYPHLTDIVNDAEIIGEHYIKTLPESFVVLAAHNANWEVLPFYMNNRSGLPAMTIYREPNNPYVALILDKARNAGNKGFYTPKSTTGARTLVKTLQDNGRVCILFDQKYNQGIEAKFFGRSAMTSPSFAQLARKFDRPILPIWIERVKGAKLRIVIEEPFEVGNRSDEEMVDYAHSLLEAHIRKNPGQWLWLHRRWIT